MLRGFRGTVFYNRCRQPPHVPTILSLTFVAIPPILTAYTAYGCARSSSSPPPRFPYSLFHLNREGNAWIGNFSNPSPSLHPSHREWISSSLSAAKKERLFFSLSLFFPLEKERGEGRTGLVVERKAKVFTAVRYGEHHGAQARWWWKAFRRKPTADCIPYIQEAD